VHLIANELRSWFLFSNEILTFSRFNPLISLDHGWLQSDWLYYLLDILGTRINVQLFADFGLFEMLKVLAA